MIPIHLLQSNGASLDKIFSALSTTRTKRIERNPRPAVFGPNCHFRWVGFDLIERAYGHVDPFALCVIPDSSVRLAGRDRSNGFLMPIKEVGCEPDHFVRRIEGGKVFGVPDVNFSLWRITQIG